MSSNHAASTLRLRATVDESESAEVNLVIDDEHLSEAQNSNSTSVLTPSTSSFLPATSILLLNIVAILWGTQHAVIKWVVSGSDTAQFTFLRFSLAALLASPYTPGLRKQASRADDVDIYAAWRWGLEMGFWMFLGFAFQGIGLEYTTAQRSGFLLYLNVKFVPFFAALFLNKSISALTWVSAVSAFCGTALLALDGQSIGWNVGDIWSIAAAAASAMFILRLETASKAIPNSATLNSACLWVVSAFSACWTLSQQRNFQDLGGQLFHIASMHSFELIYLGGVATALANYVQAKAQKDISPERASVIYSLDPVYGAFFSWLLLGETLGGTQAIVGAGLITVAAAANAFLDFGSSEEDRKQ